MQQQLPDIAYGVLAGEREAPGEVARAEGVACKVLVDIAGRPMLLRVLDVLASSFPDAPGFLSGPDAAALAALPGLDDRIERGELAWQEGLSSPARSAEALVETALGVEHPPARGLLLTTGDHPLLRPRLLQDFVDGAISTGADVVVGLASHAEVQRAFPSGRRTALKFAEGACCGCNLFWFRSLEGAAVLRFWRQLEQDRKRPDRMLRVLGPWVVARYLMGRLPLAEALHLLSERTGVRVAHVHVHDPDAAVDVDSVADLALVRARWQERAG